MARFRRRWCPLLATRLLNARAKIRTANIRDNYVSVVLDALRRKGHHSFE